MKAKKSLVGSALLAFSALAATALLSPRSEESAPPPSLEVGRNVSMISGQKLPGGDPFLQRQNEPSLAVSTRNPLHILAGANDYRTVNMSNESPEEQLPSPLDTIQAAAEGDAWLGLYKSFDGGQSWKSGLHPGFPQDGTVVGEGGGTAHAGLPVVPIKGFRAAADPVVRAGASGMFYYAGIAFNRPGSASPPGQEKGCVFLSRFIDDNNKETGDTIRFLDTKLIEEGTRGRFVDKPALAVSIPYAGDPVVVPGPGEAEVQSIPPQYVYLAFTVFPGQDPSLTKSQIWLYRSKSCASESTQHWIKSKVSEGKGTFQGVSIVVDPKDAQNVYVAWRRFAGAGETNAILVARSTDGGDTFSSPTVISSLKPFDQGSTATSFRTNSYPAMTMDSKGVVYVAWAGRKRAGLSWLPGLAKKGRSVIHVSTFDQSTASAPMIWTSPKAVDDNGKGHQFMPSLAFAGGRVVAAWYDQRNDKLRDFGDFINGIGHTIDVRAAAAAPGLSPDFAPSVQVSRYIFYLGRSVPQSVTKQLQYNHPNYPLFKKGTQPFIGDYIDIAPAPMFVPTESGGWAYNSEPSLSPVFHAAWTDNRDVRAPENGDWTDYTPPTSAQDPQYMGTGTPIEPRPGQTRIRDQNVYTASLARGLIAGSPGNAKPFLKDFWRTFVISVRNTRATSRSFRLTIVVPQAAATSGVQATFLTSDPARQKLDVKIPPRSEIARSVFAKGPEGNKAGFWVAVEEIGQPGGAPLGQEGGARVLLNPDIENPDIENPDIENPDIENPDIENPDIENPDIENAEVHNPDIENPDIENPDYRNPEALNPDIENPDIENPDIENPDIENTEIINPDIENPDIENPDIENLDIANPDIENPDIENVYNFFVMGSVRDKTWNVRNVGNTTSSYTVKLVKGESFFEPSQDIKYQLLVYRVHTNPVAAGTELKMKHHDELRTSILNPVIYNPDIENPDIENPDIENPDIENPDIENSTFFLAPGDEAKVSLRGYKRVGSYWYPLNTASIDGVVTAHARNSQNEASPQSAPPVASHYDSPRIVNKKHRLPPAVSNQPYEQAIVAIGGVPPYRWTLRSGSVLPQGLRLGRQTGLITGQAAGGSVGQLYQFTVVVTDQAGRSASKGFFIRVQ